jgi:hypothetical protein
VVDRCQQYRHQRLPPQADASNRALLDALLSLALAAPVPDATASAGRPDDRGNPGGSVPLRILLAEDNAMANQQLAVRTCSSKLGNISVTVADDGRRGR